MAATFQKQTTDSTIASVTSTSTSASPSPPPVPVPTSAQAGGQRKSRVLSRKTDHSLIERRRREKINSQLIRLQSLIPACREEAQDLLSAKPPPKASKRGKEGVSTDVKARKNEIEQSLDREIVLEKLCIISHAVDYILELQTQVAAYRKLCLCDPPPVRGEVQPRRDHQLHVQYAHEGVRQRASGGEEEVTGKDQGISPPEGAMTMGVKSSESPATLHGAMKRKRHWGSNNVSTGPTSVTAKRLRADRSQGTIKPVIACSPAHEIDAIEDNVDTDDEDDDDESESQEEVQEAVTEPEAEPDDEGYLAFSTDDSSIIKPRRSSCPTSVPHFSPDHRTSLLSTGTYPLPPLQQQQQCLPSLQSGPMGRARLRLQMIPGIFSLTPDDRQWHRAYSRHASVTQGQERRMTKCKGSAGTKSEDRVDGNEQGRTGRGAGAGTQESIGPPFGDGH